MGMPTIRFTPWDRRSRHDLAAMRTTEPRGKIYIGLLGLDQHEAGALSVARLLSDAGLEVVYGGRFNTPATIAAAAVDEDVDLIGLSCHSWEYLYYIDELADELAGAGKRIPVVVGGSVITGDDEALLRGKGVAATFGASSTPDRIVSEILTLMYAGRCANKGMHDAVGD